MHRVSVSVLLMPEMVVGKSQNRTKPNRTYGNYRTSPVEPTEIDGQLRLSIPGFSAVTDSHFGVINIIIIIIIIRSIIIIIIDFTDSIFSQLSNSIGQAKSQCHSEFGIFHAVI